MTGEPLWPIEEKPVPASDMPGEKASPTQPVPTVVPPFNRQKITSADVNPYFFSDSERLQWKKRLDAVPTGLFVPVSTKRETFSIPGAVGGAGWGSTASIPHKGIVFVRSTDFPSVYGKVIKRSIPTKEELEKSKLIAGGQSIYFSMCQSCHGADRRGDIGPELLTVKDKFNIQDFQHLVNNGKGEMPAFASLRENDIQNLYNFLTNNSGFRSQFLGPPNSNKKVTGPVVDSGGAPGGLQPRPVLGEAGAAGRLDNSYGFPYPAGTAVEKADRYYIPPGWGLSYPYLISPPWSTLTAYDLNTGKIKWQVPVGNDEDAAKLGARNTGILTAQRQGMIITSSGVLFTTGRDGKIYAYDVDNGKQIWRYQLPASTEGIPAMYEINGKHYIVICATAPDKIWKKQRTTKRRRPDAHAASG